MTNGIKNNFAQFLINGKLKTGGGTLSQEDIQKFNNELNNFFINDENKLKSEDELRQAIGEILQNSSENKTVSENDIFKQMEYLNSYDTNGDGLSTDELQVLYDDIEAEIKQSYNIQTEINNRKIESDENGDYYEVIEGDTLSEIFTDIQGRTNWQEIYDYQENADKIEIGQKIYIKDILKDYQNIEKIELNTPEIKKESPEQNENENENETINQEIIDQYNEYVTLLNNAKGITKDEIENFEEIENFILQYGAELTKIEGINLLKDFENHLVNNAVEESYNAHQKNTLMEEIAHVYGFDEKSYLNISDETVNFAIDDIKEAITESNNPDFIAEITEKLLVYNSTGSLTDKNTAGAKIINGVIQNDEILEKIYSKNKDSFYLLIKDIEQHSKGISESVYDGYHKSLYKLTDFLENKLDNTELSNTLAEFLIEPNQHKDGLEYIFNYVLNNETTIEDYVNNITDLQTMSEITLYLEKLDNKDKLKNNQKLLLEKISAKNEAYKIITTGIDKLIANGDYNYTTMNNNIYSEQLEKLFRIDKNEIEYNKALLNNMDQSEINNLKAQIDSICNDPDFEQNTNCYEYATTCLFMQELLKDY